MKKKITLIIAAIIVILLAVLFVLWKNQENNNMNELTFPPAPTSAEREAAKKLPQDQCGCWDGIHNICLPVADCI